jgi:hypothetical protein
MGLSHRRDGTLPVGESVQREAKLVGLRHGDIWD